MGSPTIFNGKFTKILTSRGLIRSDGGINEYDGPRNYIANSHFEQNTTGWSLLTTTLTSGLPTGSLTLSAASLSALATTSTTPLAGSQSLQVAAGTAWSAGQGIISTAFTIDRKDLGKMLTFKFYYEAVTGSTLINWSGILGSQSFGVYIYDTTASAWLQPAGFLGMNQGTGQGSVSGTFQTSVTAGQQYQIALIALQAPSAGAIALNVDEVYLGPQSASSMGPAMTDWVAYTPTFTGFGTCTSVNFFSRRVGDSLQVHGLFVLGTPTAVANKITFGYNGTNANVIFDTSKTLGASKVGNAIAQASSTTSFGWSVLSDASNSNVQMTFQSSTANAVSSGVLGNALGLVNGNEVTLDFEVPIVGWSSNTSQSADTDTRVVAMQASNTTAQSIPSAAFTQYTGWVASKDTHGAFNGTTYSIPVSGDYNVYGTVAFTTNTTGFRGIEVLVNASVVAEITVPCVTGNPTSLPFSVPLLGRKAGDAVTLNVFQNSGGSLVMYNSGTYNQWGINRLSGPAVVQATESVNMQYSSTAATTIAIGGTVQAFATKGFDSHNAFSGGTTYTVCVSGKYRVSSRVTTTTVTLSTSQNATISILKNAGSVASYQYNGTGGNTPVSLAITDTFSCVAGDTFQISVSSNVATTAVTSAGYNVLSIERVGN